jgi:hypothetical protein
LELFSQGRDAVQQPAVVRYLCLQQMIRQLVEPTAALRLACDAKIGRKTAETAMAASQEMLWL